VLRLPTSVNTRPADASKQLSYGKSQQEHCRTGGELSWRYCLPAGERTLAHSGRMSGVPEWALESCAFRSGGRSNNQ